MARDQRLLEGLLSKVVSEINSLLEGTASAPTQVDRLALQDIHQRYADMFAALATKGRLHVDDLHELIETVNPCITTEYRITDGKPKVAVERNFKSDSDKWAWALLVLAEQDAGCYIIQCKHCHKLALKQRGRPGKPSTEFCSPPAKCGNAHAQSELRKRRKQARSASKHK